ncbi:MAG: hypothetical protein ACYC5O_08560 [Anaerolineae bacterium]
MKLPGFITPLGLVLAALALVAVGVVLVAGGAQIISPGPLSAANPTGAVLGGVRAHAELRGNCEACHTAPWASLSMADRCLACHADIRPELADLTTLHGMLRAANCRDCHTEHGGPQASLTKVQSLVVAHDEFGFNLSRHQTTPEGQPFRCTDCHTERLTHLDQATCGACHRAQKPDFLETHLLQFGTDCLACHDGADRFSEDRFDHNLLAYPLLGKHADVPCADCHTDVRDLPGFTRASTACVSCHEAANKHPPSFGTDCALCHNTEGWPTEIFDHDLSSFTLTGAHVNVACTQCHVNNTFRGTPQDCASCHIEDDAHSLMLGTDCARCHTTTDWKQAAFEHGQTHFQLAGKHLQVPCTDCHVNNIFAGTPITCVGCHAQDDVHSGSFGSDCALCHGTDTWNREPFQHTFPLDHGGGGAIPCTTCHTVPGNYQAYTCFNCHAPADIERLHSFAVMMGTDIGDCVRCHPTGRPTTIMH